MPAKADKRFGPPVLSAISRVFAREAAQTVTEHGLRWVRGAAAPDADLTGLEAELRLDDVRAVQAGLVTDMNRIGDALYDRST
jgi:hypothetical protein